MGTTSDQRKIMARQLGDLEQTLKELRVRYEQYFSGAEKRAPLADRAAFEQLLRHISSRRIIQTDLRFRFQNLAMAFHSYAGHWDRALRNLEEGRTVRPQIRPAPQPTVPEGQGDHEVETLYRQLLEVHRTCQGAPPPSRQQVAAFLNAQRDKIRQQFGERTVEFTVVAEGGKPKIKVRAKK